MTRPPLAAAGGVLWRLRPGQLAEREIALVHRPRYDDWSLPKGKLHEHEHPLLGAVREVCEETGARVAVGQRLGLTTYRVGSEDKRVSYWVMRYRDGEHQPSAEVDTVRWVTASEAADLLSYETERQLVAGFGATHTDTAAVLLMRHARAGKRSDVKGDDRLRPLDKIGRRQARDAVPVLTAFRPDRILSALRVRCEETVQPVANELGLAIQQASELSDEAAAKNPTATMDLLHKQVSLGGVGLLCSQGEAIPALLQALDVPGDRPSRKGSLWALFFGANGLIAADYYPHPQASGPHQ